MKTKFAYPSDRDLRFVRQSGFSRQEFAEEVRIVNSAIDGVLIGCGLAALLVVLALLGL